MEKLFWRAHDWAMRWVAALVMFWRRIGVHLFAEIDERMKCPACGVREKHRILFSPHVRQVVHTCGRCSAQWAEPPVVKADAWAGPAVSVEAAAAKASWLGDGGGKPRPVLLSERPAKGAVVETTVVTNQT